MSIENVRTVYFIGIGGIGMSALARYFRHLGCEVYGYDRTKTDLTRALEAEGMHIHYEEDISQIPSAVDLVVWTPAVPTTHRELVWLREHGHTILKRAQVLGLISQTKRCIAVAGTHGKTTTTSLIAWLLHSTGTDVTAFLGGIAANFESNFILGHSDWVVVEADEYDRSFLQLEPEIAVINSLDPDHLDVYGTPQAVVEAYWNFARRVKPGGMLYYRADLPLRHVVEDLRQRGCQVATFGVEDGECQAINFRRDNGCMAFDISMRGALYEGMRLPMPGRHNIENALAAWLAAFAAGAPEQEMKRTMPLFRGVKRRFEVVLHLRLVYIDDYAHHPAEIRATITAARLFFPNKKVTGIFQPHLFSRTRDFADEFAAALDLLDTCYLLPIYPAREEPIAGVSSELIFRNMAIPDKYLVSKEDLLERLRARRPEMLLTMGAGDIDTLVKLIAQQLKP